MEDGMEDGMEAEGTEGEAEGTEGALELLRETLSSARSRDGWGEIHERLGGDPVAVLGDLIPRAIVDPSDPGAPQPDPEIVARLVNASGVLARLAHDPGGAVSAADAADLLLLKHLAGRPAIPVRDGTYTTPPPQWAFLDRTLIEPRLGAVGRIDSPEGKEVGTGFLVNTDVIMTNRHVVTDPGGLYGIGGAKLPPDAIIDFDVQLGTRRRPKAKLVEVLWVSDIQVVDLALLRIAPLDGEALPAPLFLQAEPLDPVADRLVYAIGYPLVDNSGDTPEEVMRAVFRDALGIKRMQPGKLRRLAADPRRVLHDCSTLGGSSGSCVVDYASGVVVGLHCAGFYKRRNEAVALWTVLGHEKIAPHLP